MLGKWWERGGFLAGNPGNFPARCSRRSLAAPARCASVRRPGGSARARAGGRASVRVHYPLLWGASFRERWREERWQRRSALARSCCAAGFCCCRLCAWPRFSLILSSTQPAAGIPGLFCVSAAGKRPRPSPLLLPRRKQPSLPRAACSSQPCCFFLFLLFLISIPFSPLFYVAYLPFVRVVGTPCRPFDLAFVFVFFLSYIFFLPVCFQHWPHFWWSWPFPDFFFLFSSFV